jgi:hypothetical protein
MRRGKRQRSHKRGSHPGLASSIPGVHGKIVDWAEHVFEEGMSGSCQTACPTPHRRAGHSRHRSSGENTHQRQGLGRGRKSHPQAVCARAGKISDLVRGVIHASFDTSHAPLSEPIF